MDDWRQIILIDQLISAFGVVHIQFQEEKILSLSTLVFFIMVLRLRHCILSSL